MADDRNSDGIPDADAPAGDSEKVRARSFGGLIDEMVAGAPPPPALEADQRELLDLASSLRASMREVNLAAGRRDALIDDALERAIGAGDSSPARIGGGGSEVASLARKRRGQVWRIAPWIATAVAAAAAVALFVSRPAPSSRTVESVVERPMLSQRHLSRPADSLIGKIQPGDADRASDRIDIIYADRMAGYRNLRLSGLRKGAGQ